MTIDERGNVVWTRESDDHRLYYVNNNGVWSDDYVSVSDRSILDDLTKTEAKVDGGANLLDAGVDYSIDDGFSSIADNKTIEEAFVGFAIDVASSEASKAMQKAFVKDANAKLAPSVAAPLTKAERASLRSRKAFAESETFSVMLDDLFSFTSGMVEKVTFELVLPPRNIEKEKEDD